MPVSEITPPSVVLVFSAPTVSLLEPSVTVPSPESSPIATPTSLKAMRTSPTPVVAILALLMSACWSSDTMPPLFWIVLVPPLDVCCT